MAPFLEGQAHPPPPRRVVEQKLGEATRSAACSHGTNFMIRTELVTESSLRFCSFHLRCSQTDNHHPTNSTTPQLSPRTRQPMSAGGSIRSSGQLLTDRHCTAVADERFGIVGPISRKASTTCGVSRACEGLDSSPPDAAAMRSWPRHIIPSHEPAIPRECGCRWRRMGRRDYGNLGNSQSASYIMSTPGISTHA